MLAVAISFIWLVSVAVYFKDDSVVVLALGGARVFLPMSEWEVGGCGAMKVPQAIKQELRHVGPVEER
jgi:hypothetical protein